MVLSARQRFSFAEYVALEETSTVKHEYLDGQVWAMAGGTPDHGAIAANLIALLALALPERPCRVFTSDVRVRVKTTGLATYPDVSVVCGRQEIDPEDPSGNTIINPQILVEVLSPSTEDYDRGEKPAHYKQVPSLREIVLVAQDERRIELWQRVGDHWSLELRRDDAALELASIDAELPLSEIYKNPLAAD